MSLLGMDGPYGNGIGCPAEPERTEVEIFHVRKEKSQGWIQGNRQNRGNDHREVLGIGKRFEEAALLSLERQHGKKRDCDHQQRKETRTRHLLHRPDDDVAIILLAACLLPLLQTLVSLLDDHDGCVDHRPDGDGNPSEGHDVGRHPHHTERDEGKEGCNRDGDDRDEGARDMPEEEQDDQRDGEDDLDQCGLQIIDGAKDQIGTVIDGDDLYARRKAGFNLLDLCLDPVDDVEGILALPHDDDPGDDLSFSV